MLGLKRRLFPTVLIAMRKNLLPYLSVSEPQGSLLNAWPKRDKVWVNELMLIMWKTILLFPKAVDVSLPMHSFGFFVWKKKGARWGDERDGVPRFFSELIYLLLFITTLLLKLFCETKSRVGHRSQSTSRLTKSCIALKILAQHLHVPKRLFMGCVSSFGRFFLECILCTFNPVRYCNNTGTFHPPGLREGNRAKKKSGGLKPSM